MELLVKLGISPGEIVYIEDTMTLITYLELGRGFAILGEGVAKTRPAIDYISIPKELGGIEIVAVWKQSMDWVDLLVSDDNFMLSSDK